MRRLVLLATAGVLVAIVGYSVFAAQPEWMGRGMMMEKGHHWGCPMCSMMCKAMTSGALVATEDGGVILMAGCKLTKFDKDLNKVKEVPIEVDIEAMQNKMQKMMESCPLYKKQEGTTMPMMKSMEKEKPAIEHPTGEHPK